MKRNDITQRVSLDIYIVDIDVSNNVVYGRDVDNNVVCVKVNYNPTTNFIGWIKDLNRFNKFLELYEYCFVNIEKLFKKKNIKWACNEATEFGAQFDKNGVKKVPKGIPYEFCLKYDSIKWLLFFQRNSLVFGFEILLGDWKDYFITKILISILDESEMSLDEKINTRVLGEWVNIVTSRNSFCKLNRDKKDYELIYKLQPSETIWSKSCETKILNFTKIYFDIEVGSKDELVQSSKFTYTDMDKNRAIAIISFVIVNNDEDGKEQMLFLCLVNTNNFTVSNFEDVVVDDKKIEIIFCSSQKSLLEKSIEILMKADLICGHYITRYDNREMLTWISKYDLHPDFFTLNIQKMNRHQCQIASIALPWQMQVDSKLYFDIIVKENKTSLDYLGEKYLKMGKFKLGYLELNINIFNFLNSGDYKHIKTSVEYCLIDSLLVKKLFEPYLFSFIGFCRVGSISVKDFSESFGSVPYISTYSKCVTILIERPFPIRFNNFYGSELKQSVYYPYERDKYYKGGFVKEVDSDNSVFKSIIKIVDVNSLYPSLTAGGCNGFSAVFSSAGFVEYISTCPKEIQESIKANCIVKNSSDKDENNDLIYIAVKPSEDNDYNDTFSIIQKMNISLRKKTIGERDKHSKNSIEYLKNNILQTALKLNANALYGHMGKPKGKFLRNFPTAACITFFGRDIIKRSGEYIERNNWGKIKYSDTDSLFIETSNDNIDLTDKVNKFSEKYFSKSVQFSEEGVYKYFFQYKKKNYICVNPNTKAIKITGLEKANYHILDSLKVLFLEICTKFDNAVESEYDYIIGQTILDNFKKLDKKFHVGYQKISLDTMVVTKFHYVFMYDYIYDSINGVKLAFYYPMELFLKDVSFKNLHIVTDEQVETSFTMPIPWITQLSNTPIKLDSEELFSLAKELCLKELVQIKKSIKQYMPYISIIHKNEKSKCIPISIATGKIRYTSNLVGSLTNKCLTQLRKLSQLEVLMENWKQVMVMGCHNILDGESSMNRPIDVQLLRKMFDVKFVCIHSNLIREDESLLHFINHLLLLNRFLKSSQSFEDYFSNTPAMNVCIETPIGYVLKVREVIKFFPNLKSVHNCMVEMLKLKVETIQS